MTLEDVAGAIVAGLVICNLVAIPVCLISIARTLDLLRKAGAIGAHALSVIAYLKSWSVEAAKVSDIEKVRKGVEL